MTWYYALNGSQQGPVSEQEIAQLAAAGTLSASTLIWRDGMADWRPLSEALPAALGTATMHAPQLSGVSVPAADKDLVVQQMREGVQPTLAGKLDYAGFWIRFAAKIIDSLILMVPGFLLQFLLLGSVGAFQQGANGEPNMAQLGMTLFVWVADMTIRALYTVILVSKYQATWGKMAVGIKVVNDDGSKISTGKSIGRFFAEILSGMTCGIGYIIAGFDEEKRSLHDHICTTRVIKSN